MAVRHLWKRTQEERRGRRARARVRKRFVYLQLEEASCRAAARTRRRRQNNRGAPPRTQNARAREKIPPRGPSDRAAGLETKTNTSNDVPPRLEPRGVAQEGGPQGARQSREPRREHGARRGRAAEARQARLEMVMPR